MSGANTFTGLITINSGSVVLAQGGTMTGANGVTFGASGIGGGTLNINAPSAGGTTALGALTSTGGSNTVQSTYGSSGTALLSFTSLGAYTGGTTLNFVTSGGGSSNTITVTGAGGTNALLGIGAAGSGSYFFNGADFAFTNASGSAIRAPSYGTDPVTYTVGSGISGWNTSPGSNAIAAQNGLLLTNTSTLFYSEQITTSSGLSGLVVQNAAVNAASHSGSLLRMLMPLAERGINLSKIESRPSKKRPWDYYFFIDVSGHYDDPKMKEALAELQKFCPFVKWLGSYPAAS